MIPYIDGTTTAIWSWRTDNGNFVPYSNKVNVDLEMNYLQGAKTFDVDKLRYVNFKKPFQQYRKPFKTNGRDVTREVPGSFFNNVLVLLTEDQSLKNKYIEEVNARGGIVTDYITPVVTYVIVDKLDVKKFQPQLKEAMDLCIHVLCFEFIDHASRSENETRLLNPEPYSIDISPSDLEDLPVVVADVIPLKPSLWKGTQTMNSQTVSLELFIQWVHSSGTHFFGTLKQGPMEIISIKGFIQGNSLTFLKPSGIFADNSFKPFHGELEGTTITGNNIDRYDSYPFVLNFISFSTEAMPWLQPNTFWMVNKLKTEKMEMDEN